jgi:hypothetical protein
MRTCLLDILKGVLFGPITCHFQSRNNFPSLTHNAYNCQTQKLHIVLVSFALLVLGVQMATVFFFKLIWDVLLRSMPMSHCL